MLPEEFWQARPVFQHIRQAAHSRTTSADAVFHAVLARVAAQVPYQWQLPPIVGSPKPLSYFTISVGAPGVGKSNANEVAAELLPFPSSVVELPAGSGEGLIEALF